MLGSFPLHSRRGKTCVEQDPAGEIEVWNHCLEPTATSVKADFSVVPQRGRRIILNKSMI